MNVLFITIFHFSQENNLISPNQSGFKPGDSCTNQLLAITHELYKSFDDGNEARGVFLDISKAINKAWHKSLIYKLKQNGISGKLLNLTIDFLTNRKQRVVLNGKYSSETNIEAEVPQGSIMEPLFFLIYINDLSDNLITNPKLFADDTFLFPIVHDPNGGTPIDLNNDQNHPCLHFSNNPVNQKYLQKHPRNASCSKIRLFRTLKKRSDQNEQINCFIVVTPNYSPKNNVTNNLSSFYWTPP